jgi:hypothetical protein
MKLMLNCLLGSQSINLESFLSFYFLVVQENEPLFSERFKLHLFVHVLQTNILLHVERKYSKSFKNNLKFNKKYKIVWR